MCVEIRLADVTEPSHGDDRLGLGGLPQDEEVDLRGLLILGQHLQKRWLTLEISAHTRLDGH